MTVSDAAFREAAIRVLSPALIAAVEAEAENQITQSKGAGEDLAAVKPPSLASQVREVFAAWVVATGKNAATKLDSNRENLITKSIKSHGLETTLDAVRGVALSDFHMGRDPKALGKKYNGLDLVLRNAEKIEHFAGLSQMERRNVAASEHVDHDDKHAALVQEFIDAVHSIPGGWRSLEHLPVSDVSGMPVQYGVKVKGVWVYSFADVALDHASIMYSAAAFARNCVFFDETARQVAEFSVTSAFESLRAAHARSVKMGRAA
jgi:hypothetical protein